MGRIYEYTHIYTYISIYLKLYIYTHTYTYQIKAPITKHLYVLKMFEINKTKQNIQHNESL